MRTVIKNKGKIVTAYKLGSDSPEIQKLIDERKIICREDGTYEVFSQESLNGGTRKGQEASTGDYIKLDSSGFPYPNSASFFEQNHRHIEGCQYEQLPKPMKAWMFSDPMCSEILFLMQCKGLVIKPDDYDHYFTAPLFGTVESAARDAVIVFYSIEYDPENSISDIDFNFVAKKEFDKTYSVLSD